MKFESEQEAVIERLSDILLGVKIPIDICGERGSTVIIPAYKIVTKTLLKKVYLADKEGALEIEASPVRRRVFETILSAKEQYKRQIN
jgi:DNA-directed RNA polymerase subunit beta